MTGVQLYVQANNHKTEYYTAKTEIRMGEKITDDKLARVEANIDAASDKYFTRADTALMQGKIATQRIPAGNLISREAIGTETPSGRRLATITIDRTAAATRREQLVWRPRHRDQRRDRLHHGRRGRAGRER